MNKSLLAAALLAAFTACIHVFMGGQEIAAPLLASSLAEVPKLTLYAVWHMASIALALSAVSLYLACLPHHASASRYMVLFISALWTGFGIIFLVVAAVQSGEELWLKLPQWILLLPVGLMGFWGCARNNIAASEETDQWISKK